MASITIKTGDSFEYLATIPSTFADGYFVGWDVASQIRTKQYQNLVAELSCVWVDPVTTRTLKVSKIVTTGWPVGVSEMDVQFVRQSDQTTISTETIDVNIIKDVTKTVVA